MKKGSLIFSPITAPRLVNVVLHFSLVFYRGAEKRQRAGKETWSHLLFCKKTHWERGDMHLCRVCANVCASCFSYFPFPHFFTVAVFFLPATYEWGKVVTGRRRRNAKVFWLLFSAINLFCQ